MTVETTLQVDSDFFLKSFFDFLHLEGYIPTTSRMSSSDPSLSAIASNLYHNYITTTSKKIKIIDVYLLYILLTGIIQFVYCVLVGTFPFNSFLSGFISTVGCFALTGMSKRRSINFG